MINEEKLEQLIKSVEEFKNAKTFEELFKNLDKPSIYDDELIAGVPGTRDNFKTIRATSHLNFAINLNEAEKSLKKAKFYMEYLDCLYANYKSRENEIANPCILDFIRDYEKEMK